MAGVWCTAVIKELNWGDGVDAPREFVEDIEDFNCEGGEEDRSQRQAEELAKLQCAAVAKRESMACLHKKEKGERTSDR